MTASAPARIAGAVLALVLLVSAVAKLRRPAGTARELRELGLALAGPLARLTPVVELAVAVALIALPAWGGVAAFALLAAFTAVLVGVLRSGRVVSCACFGALSDRPVSWRGLARNAALLAVAAVAAAG